MQVKSNIIPGLYYDSDKCVYITCVPQVQFYMQSGCHIQDILYSGTKTGNLVFVFEKNAKTQKAYIEWKTSKPN